MQRKLSPRPTFKPQLEALEVRDVPSAAGIAVFMQMQSLQQGVQVMQTQADAATNNFNVNLGSHIQNGNSDGIRADFTKIGGEVQSVRLLDAQIQAGLQGVQQAIPALLGGDEVDHFVALQAFSQINGLNLFGGLFGGMLGGGSGASLTSQAQDALDEVNKVADATTIPKPNGTTSNVSTWIDVQTIDDLLS